MADQNVPPRRPRDDRGWDGRQHPTSDGYRDLDHATTYGAAAGYGGPAGYPGAATTLPAQGSQWVGPDGFGRQGYAPAPGAGLPNLDDDDQPGRRTGRRRALAALGGAAVVAGGAALAMNPQVRGLFRDDPVAGDATGTVVTDGTAARPSGQQPSTVRTYTEQNESYLGSRVGAALKRNPRPAAGSSTARRRRPRRPR